MVESFPDRAGNAVRYRLLGFAGSVSPDRSSTIDPARARVVVDHYCCAVMACTVRRSRAVRGAGIPAVVIALSALAACGQPASPGAGAGQPQAGGASLNNVTAGALVDTFGQAGLPVNHPRDSTTARCPDIRCTQAIDTDTVSVLKFPTTGIAEQYANATANVSLVEDLVVIFPPALSTDQRAAYERISKHLILGSGS